MKTRFAVYVVAFLLLAAYACKKEVSNPPVPQGKPSIAVVTEDTAVAGTRHKFNLTLLSTSSLKRLAVEVIRIKANGDALPTVKIMDSAFGANTYNAEFNIFYEVPDSVRKGDKIEVRFLLSNQDDELQFSRQLQGGNPAVSFSVKEEKTSITLGETIKYDLLASSSIPINRLVITQSGGAGGVITLKDSTFQSVTQKTLTYAYIYPGYATAGDYKVKFELFTTLGDRKEVEKDVVVR